MKKSLVLTGILTTLLMGTAAYAFDDNCAVPMSKWQSRVAVQDLAIIEGWELQRIKIDDGCYEIYALDSTGRQIEVKLNPATLAIVKFEYEHDEDHNEDHEEDDEKDNGHD